MKKCPFCSEEIQDDAKKCKHCGEWLEGTMVDIKKQITPQKLDKHWDKIKKFLITISLIGFILYGIVLFGEEMDKQKYREIASEERTVQSIIEKKKADCLQGKNISDEIVVSTIAGKEWAEKELLKNKCTADDLNVDYEKTKMDTRVDRCRDAKKTIDTYDYNKCLEEKGL